MRTIPLSAIILFTSLMVLAVSMATAAVWAAWPFLALTGAFTGLAACAAFVLLLYGSAIALYRLVFAIAGVPRGDFAPQSRQEFLMNLHILFTLMLFQPVVSSLILPVPLLRLFYQSLGARMGANTYSAGLIFDAFAVTLGTSTIIGQKAMLIPHVIEGDRLALFPISVGSRVTIGANAVILAGVEIGDGATVAIGAVVTKGTRIPPGQVWGGIPARCIRPHIAAPVPAQEQGGTSRIARTA